MQITIKSLTFVTFLSLLFVFSALPALSQAAGPAGGEETLPLGEAVEDSQPLTENVPLISTLDFIRMLVILAVVVGVIYLLFFLLKKGVNRRLPDNETIRIVGSRTLTGTRALHLVEVGRSLFLIGVSDNSVSLISEISDQESIDRVRLENSQAARAARTGFAGLLAGLIRPGKQRELELGGTIEYMQKQQERLKNL